MQDFNRRLFYFMIQAIVVVCLFILILLRFSFSQTSSIQRRDDAKHEKLSKKFNPLGYKDREILKKFQVVTEKGEKENYVVIWKEMNLIERTERVFDEEEFKKMHVGDQYH